MYTLQCGTNLGTIVLIWLKVGFGKGCSIISLFRRVSHFLNGAARKRNTLRTGGGGKPHWFQDMPLFPGRDKTYFVRYQEAPAIKGDLVG